MTNDNENNKLATVDSDAGRMVSAIMRAAADPSIDVSKLERLLALQKELLADQARTSFRAAKARLEAQLPQIAKSGRITHDGKLRNKFARLEDIDQAVRPLCAAEGFAFSFDSRPVPGGVEYSCEMSHCEGHAEVKTLTLPLDTGAGRNGVQAVGSSTSYARRYLLEMHLHLVKRDEDDDGHGGQRPVTQEQADAMRQGLADAGGNEARFLNWMGAESFEAVLSGNYERAMKFIKEKKR